MDFQQLQYVVAIAECESMTAAAEKMFVSQSALSLSYKKLEHELGVSLFRKHGRSLELTAAGETFYQKAKIVLTAMSNLQTAMQAISEEQKQNILVCTEAVDFTNEAIKLYSRSCPAVFFQQVRGSTEEIRSMLSSGAADFAVALSPNFGAGTEAQLLLDEPMYSLINLKGNLSESETISLSQLNGKQIVTLRKGLAVNNLFDSFFEKAGITHGRVIEVNDPETIIMEVSNGFGVSFIPESTANHNIFTKPPFTAGTKAIPVEEDFCHRQIYLIVVKGRKMKKGTQDFIEFLTKLGTYIKLNKCFPVYEELPKLL